MSCSTYQNPETDPFLQKQEPRNRPSYFQNIQEAPLTTRPPPTIPHTIQYSIICAILNKADSFYNLSQHVVMGWFVYISL